MRFFPLRIVAVLAILYLTLTGVCFAQIDSEKETSVVVISDLNDAYGSTDYGKDLEKALEFIRLTRPDLVLCAGDMVAGQHKKLSEHQLLAMWQSFEKNILTELNRLNIPFAFTLGNHDGANSPNFRNERKIAVDFWNNNLPNLRFIDSNQFPHYYSFMLNGVFYVSIDASTSRIESTQIEWLKNQLGSERSKSAKIRIVFGHLPLYAISQGRNTPGNVIGNADHLFNLLNENSVNLYISGHHHAFYISQKNELLMLSAGALGGGPKKLIGSENPPVKSLSVLKLTPNSRTIKFFNYDVGKGMKPIKASELPTGISGFNGVSKLYRFD